MSKADTVVGAISSVGRRGNDGIIQRSSTPNQWLLSVFRALIERILKTTSKTRSVFRRWKEMFSITLLTPQQIIKSTFTSRVWPPYRLAFHYNGRPFAAKKFMKYLHKAIVFRNEGHIECAFSFGPLAFCECFRHVLYSSFNTHCYQICSAEEWTTQEN